MKALQSVTPGPDGLCLSDIAQPKPGPSEVLVRIHACGVNYPDVLLLEDKYQLRPERPFVPGAEFAGEVVAVGDYVSNLQPGHRIMAMAALGGMAEMAVLPAHLCVQIPDAMPFDDASAFLMTYGTAYHALTQRGTLRAGETMLVLGAAGGVGLAAVELGAAMGAKVVAAASSQEKVDVAIARGASDGIVYPADPDSVEGKALQSQFKSKAGLGFDVVFDTVGGAYSEPSLRAIAWKGRFLVVGFPAGVARLPLNLTLLKGCAVVGVFYGAFTEREPELARKNIGELLDLYSRGKIKPYISDRFPLARGGEAIALLRARKAKGKVVIEIDQPGQG